MPTPNTNDDLSCMGQADLVRSQLDPAGPSARLQRLADDYAPGLGFAPNTRFSGPLEEVPAGVVTDLERVLEESLTNIAYHARARWAEVTVRLAGGVITLRVSDDGIGCAGAPTDGGLADLRRRASWYGGTLTLEPGRSGGTRLTWTVPLSPPNTLN